MACELPKITRSDVSALLRLGLIIVNILFMYWRMERVKSISINDENDSSIHYERANLSVMIIHVILNSVFILAAQCKFRNLLKVSLFGNIASVLVFTLYSFCAIIYYSYSLYAQYQVSVKWKYLQPLFRNLGIVVSGASIETIISYAMLLLCNEIKDLETSNYLFRFVNAATEPKCLMEYEEDNIVANEAAEVKEDTFEKINVSIEEYTFEKGTLNIEEDTFENDTVNIEQDTFENGTVEIEENSIEKETDHTEEGIDEVDIKGQCDYPLSDVVVVETKCTLEC